MFQGGLGGSGGNNDLLPLLLLGGGGLGGHPGKGGLGGHGGINPLLMSGLLGGKGGSGGNDDLLPLLLLGGGGLGGHPGKGGLGGMNPLLLSSLLKGCKDDLTTCTVPNSGTLCGPDAEGKCTENGGPVNCKKCCECTKA